MLSLIWAVVVTCGILALAYWFTRHIAGRIVPNQFRRGRHITILEQVAVGKDQRLVLAQIGEHIYILASTPHTITNLGELPQEEAAQFMLEEQPQPIPSDTFVQVMHRVLARGKGGGRMDGRMD